MSGRGSGVLFFTSDKPDVTIGITLGTSPAALSLESSGKDPFYITVTARILKTPHPDRAITMAIHLNPLDGITNRSFENIVCVNGPEKHIPNYPSDWPHYLCDSENLKLDWDFVTIPPVGQGVYTTRHEVRRDHIEAANLKKGEKYRVKLSNKCLGAKWWSYGSLEELEGVRFRNWEERDENGKLAHGRDASGYDARLEREKYGDGPVSEGEDPYMLKMVPEGDAEFEIG